MRYRRLGRTGLKVSEFCLGCMTFGGQADEETSLGIMEKCFEAGVNFFDTANVYTRGRSEEIVGRFLKGRRHQVVLATKVRAPTGTGPNDTGLSRAHLMQSVEQSLKRLQTDYIDLYQAHAPDPATPLEETLRAFDDLVRQGKVRYLGCSNFAAWQLCKALWVSDVRGLARFDSIQPRYNLLYRDIEQELLPLCKAEGVGVMVYNPIAGGFLTGKYSRENPPPEGTRFALAYRTSMGRPMGEIYRERYWLERNFEAVDRLQAIAQEHDQSLIHLAIAWVLANPTVTSAIVGANSVAQVTDSLGAVGLTLSEEEMRACDTVWAFLQERDGER